MINTSLSFKNKTRKSDIALFCILLILTVLFTQMFFTEYSTVYAIGEKLFKFLIKQGGRIVGELIFDVAKGLVYKGISWAISSITTAMALKIASLIIVVGIVALYIVGIVVIVSNIVKSYNVKNEVTGCVMNPGGTHWVCPYTLPDPA